MARPEARRVAVAALLLASLYAACSAVYRWSPGHHQIADNCYSLAVAENIWRHGSLRIDAALPPDRRTLPGYVPETGLPYQLLAWPTGTAGPVYYAYPIGSSVLSAPLVGYHAAKDRGPLEPGTGRYSPEREGQLQRRLAAGVTAAIAVLFLLIARCWLPWRWAVPLTLLFAFGSMMWSSMSRAMWSHDWAVLLLAFAVLGLARNQTRPGSLNRWALGAYLGTALAWMILVRPQTGLSAAAIGGFLLLRHRRLIFPTGVAGAVWLGAFAAISYHVFGRFTPPSIYANETFSTVAVGQRAADLLVAPSRGLFVFCPYFLAVLAGLVAFRRSLPAGRGLIVPAAAAILAQFALLAVFLGWHGGASYGPRHFCDVLPWWFVLATLALRAALDRPEHGAGLTRRIGFALAVAAVLLTCGWSVFVHARGAVSPQAWLWLCRMGPGGEAVLRDWGHPQFFGGFTHEVHLDGTVTPKEWQAALPW